MIYQRRKIAGENVKITFVRFIFPWSKRQSKIKLREKYPVGLEVYPFEGLNPKRIEVINCLGINMEEPLPLWRRLKGRFWESLEFWVLPPPVQEFIVESSVVLSPLFGLLKVDTPIPYAEQSWEDNCQGSELKDWWKESLKQTSKEIFKDQVVVPLVGKQEEGLLDLGTAHKVVRFFFYKKGQKVINPQPHRAYLLRYIAEKRLSLEELSKINFYDYRVKEIEEKGKLIRVIVEGQGAYI
jgi:cytoplasmic iron level regulating protein YaaA (DUF328/UPF0246 family)